MSTKKPKADINLQLHYDEEHGLWILSERVWSGFYRTLKLGTYEEILSYIRDMLVVEGEIQQ